MLLKIWSMDQQHQDHLGSLLEIFSFALACFAQWLELALKPIPSEGHVPQMQVQSPSLIWMQLGDWEATN